MGFEEDGKELSPITKPNISQLTATYDPNWVKTLLGDGRITWYHASALDGRPVMALRALLNWNIGTEKENTMFRNVGIELSNTTLVFSDYSDSAYCRLLKAYQHTQGEISGGQHIIQTLEHIDPYAIEIEPFTIFKNEERVLYNMKYNVTTTDREYDGFILKLTRSGDMAASSDSIVFFCMDDYGLKELFDLYGIEVVAVFENQAGNEGSSGIKQLYSSSDEAASIKYLFTDMYNYQNRLYCDHHPDYCYSDKHHENDDSHKCGETCPVERSLPDYAKTLSYSDIYERGWYSLYSFSYDGVFDEFQVYNFVEGRDELIPIPTSLPERELKLFLETAECRCLYEPQSNIVGYGGGFCLALKCK